MDIKEFRKKYPQYDDMSDIELSKRLYQKHYKDIPFNTFLKSFGVIKNKEKTFMDKWLPSVVRANEIALEEQEQGKESFVKAFEEPGLKNTIYGGLGAAQWLFSPFTGFARGIVAEPPQEAMKNLGVPEGVANFAGDMIETAVGFLPYGKAVQTAIKTKKGLEETKLAQQAFEQSKKLLKQKPKVPLKFPEPEYVSHPAIKIKDGNKIHVIEGPYSKGGHINIVNEIDKSPKLKALFDKGEYVEGAVTHRGRFVEKKPGVDFSDIKGRDIFEDAIKDAIEPISEANQKILKTDVVDDVITELKTPVGEKYVPTESKRITQEVVDYIMANPDEVTKVAEKYNLSPEQLGAQIKETMTLAGRDLGRMGRFAKELNKKFATPYMKQLSAYMERQVPDTAVMDKFGKAFKTIENTRRAALVSQVATTMRNIISQGARLSLGTIDAAFQGAAKEYLKSGGKTTFSSVKSSLRGMGEGLDLVAASINRLRPKERARLLEILNTKNALEAKATMFTTPVQDVVLTSKVSKVLNVLNTTQEYFFRNIAFEGKLRQLARSAGLDLSKINPKDIPESMLKAAAEYSLDMTFASMPKSKFGQEFVKAMSNPVMTALGNPFPRFLWGNALPFLKRFSPIQFLEAARPSVVADIVSGNPEKFAKAISEATLGTMMLNLGSYIRNSEYAGEKWYEIKVGKKTIDTRAFAPFSTYLFIAEAMKDPERIKPADYGSALLSLNRIGGTGLVLSDIMRGRDMATTKDPMKRLAGAYISGFSVPVRTVKDIYSAFDEEEAVYRDMREDEFLGPTKQNIPGLSQTMPKARTPLRVGDIKAEHPALRQFTGLSVKTKTEIQKEVDSVQLAYNKIYPGTGSPEGDRIVAELMAPDLEKAISILKKETNYNELDVLSKRIVLGEIFNGAKKKAREKLSTYKPNLALQIRIDDLPLDVRELLKQKGVLPQ